jgi:hypothetical protein
MGGNANDTISLDEKNYKWGSSGFEIWAVAFSCLMFYPT